MNGGRMSLTQGMSEHWGSYLVSSSPFRLRLKRLIKKIIEFVRVLIPKRRKKFKYKIKVLGDTYFPKRTLMTVKIEGKKDFRKILLFLLEDEDE
jgi:hypothetical protein